MTEQTPGEAFAEWIGAQFAPDATALDPAPEETPPTGPRPDPSQGGHGGSPRPASGAQHLVDLIYEHNRPDQPTGGWHDIV